MCVQVGSGLRWCGRQPLFESLGKPVLNSVNLQGQTYKDKTLMHFERHVQYKKHIGCSVTFFRPPQTALTLLPAAVVQSVLL